MWIRTLGTAQGDLFIVDISSPWTAAALGCTLASVVSCLWLAYGPAQPKHPVRDKRSARARPKPPARGEAVLDRVGVVARDGRSRVRGEYLPVAAGRAAVVLASGPDRRRFTELTQALRAQGITVLAIELRGGAGRRGRHEVLGAIDYLLDRGHPPGRIGVMGAGTGANAVLGAAADEPAIRAVLAVGTGTTLDCALQPDPLRTAVSVRAEAHTARTVAFFCQHLIAPRTVCVIWPQPAHTAPAVAWERLAA